MIINMTICTHFFNDLFYSYPNIKQQNSTVFYDIYLERSKSKLHIEPLANEALSLELETELKNPNVHFNIMKSMVVIWISNHWCNPYRILQIFKISSLYRYLILLNCLKFYLIMKIVHNSHFEAHDCTRTFQQTRK